MFKSFFSKFSGNKKESSVKDSKSELPPATAALLRAIDEKRKTDPLIGVKIGGKEVFQRVLNGMKDNRGVHAESLLCSLGSLAGYSCQASLRTQASNKGLPETAALTTIDTASGKKYFFGDPLNQALAESQYSVWGLAAGAAQQHGCKNFPDLQEIFAHTSQAIGGEQFGIPRLPQGHNTGDIPINYLKALWPVLFPVTQMFCKDPSEWPLVFGIAIQEAIDMCKNTLTPELALTIIMESAIPMSKVDLTAA